MALRKVPMRKCLGCGEMYPQRELVRVVKTKLKSDSDKEEYEISLDLTGKKAGRGAYICKKRECFLLAKKARRFSKALCCEIPEDVMEKMEQEIMENE